MPVIEHAKLIPVTGNADTPDNNAAIDVQFNPSTLKVSLSNTLKENARGGNSRTAQFVDKSSSSLTIELIYDTSADFVRVARNNGNSPDIKAQAGSDVRKLTKKIAEKFLKPIESGERLKAPKRCLFQWGAFEFVGLVQSYDETLDFFSPEGIPLRATLALKLSEDRFQFRSKDKDIAKRETPKLTSTGASDKDPAPPGPGDNKTVPDAAQEANKDPKDWRDTAMFNGIENPRLPSAEILAVPSVSLSGSVGGSVRASAGASIGVSGSASFGMSAGVTASSSASVSASLGVSQAFKFGSSASLGSGIEGAFQIDSGGKAGFGLSAGSLINGGASLRSSDNVSITSSTTTSKISKTTITSSSSSVAVTSSVGFD